MSRPTESTAPSGSAGDVELVVRVERSQFAALIGLEAVRPVTVDQRTCERVIGIPRTGYLRACRLGAFAYRREGKRRVALTREVEAFWTRGLADDGAGSIHDVPTPAIAVTDGERMIDTARWRTNAN